MRAMLIPPAVETRPHRTVAARGTAERLLLLGIAALGLLSLLLYWWTLAAPYFLPRYVLQPLLDLGKIGGYDPDAGKRFTLSLALLWLAYGGSVLLAWRVRAERWLLALAGLGGLGGGLVLLWLYPITAADIFNYLLYGLVQHQGGNPLVQQPNQVVGPPLIDYSAWPAHPSPYGPVWQSIAWGVTALTGERLLAGLLGFKLVLLACHLLNSALIAHLAGRVGQLRPGVAALVYAWNPLLLYETVGNGHNDIIMLTGLLLALWAWSAPRTRLLSLPLITLAALAKYVAALWAPVFLLAWLPARWRARRFVLPGLSLLLSAALVVICYARFWEDGHALDGVRRQADLYTSSVAGLLMIYFAEGGRLRDPDHFLRLLKYGAGGIVFLVLLIARPRSTAAREVVRALFDTSLAYLLVAALWFQPWYLVPLVGLLPLVGPARRAIAVVYALGATGSYIVYFYLWPALGWTGDRLLIQRWAVAVAHGPAVAALLLAMLWHTIATMRRAAKQSASLASGD